MSSGPLHGVIALALRNKKSRFFLASKENWFGGLKVEAVMIDSGCNSLLLPLPTQQDIINLPNLFPPGKGFLWEISNSKGVQAKSLTLRIKVANGTIPISLCKDLLPPSIPGVGFSYLRFHLCSEDVAEILKKPDMYGMQDHDLKVLQAWTTPIKRRNHALLGQILLYWNGCASFQHQEMFAVVLHAVFPLVQGWDLLTQLDQIARRSVSLPEKFDDLEDEDHDGDDEEIFCLHDEDYED